MKIITEDEKELLKISTDIIMMCEKFVEEGASPMQIAGCLMATASRMYQEQLSEEEWLALMDSVVETTTNQDKTKTKETLH